MKKIFTFCVTATLLFSTTSFSQGINMFLKIDGIEGEAIETTHKNETKIFSYSVGMSSCPDFTTSGGKTCKPSFSELNVMLRLEKSIIPLKMGVAQGKVFANADFVVERPASGRPFVFFRMHMEEVTIASVQESGSTGGDDTPTVSASFSFSRVAWEYVEQKADGSAGAKTTGGWDLKASRPFAYAFN